MKTRLRKGLQKGIESLRKMWSTIKNLRRSEKRKIHLLFSSQKYSAGFLLSHLNVYKRCYKLKVSELDVIIMLIQVVFTAIVVATASLTKYSPFDYILLSLVGIMYLILFQRISCYQDRGEILRFLIVPLTNIYMISTMAITDHIASDIDIMPISEHTLAIKSLLNYFNVFFFIEILIFLPLFLDIMLSVKERVLSRKRLSLILSFINIFVIPLGSLLNIWNYPYIQTPLHEIQKFLTAITNIYGISLIIGLFALFLSFFMFILLLVYPLLFNSIKLEDDYICLLYTSPSPRDRG